VRAVTQIPGDRAPALGFALLRAVAAKLSAGVLLFRLAPDGEIEVLLVHPGGPFWARRDEGAWSIPKGEYREDEDALAAARREFVEELGHEIPAGEPLDLGTVTQSSGKRVRAWAVEGDLDASAITSNTFELEWPPRSGRREQFPEVDRAAWFDLAEAREKLVKAQVAFLERLAEALPARGQA
jgi:predicted NUDIX family NTP pyrophosphohydrolase